MYVIPIRKMGKALSPGSSSAFKKIDNRELQNPSWILIFDETKYICWVIGEHKLWLN